MLISQLPEPYKSLAIQRRKEFKPHQIDEDNLNSAFAWYKTPEKEVFWSKCYRATTKKELPKLFDFFIVFSKEKIQKMINYFL